MSLPSLTTLTRQALTCILKEHADAYGPVERPRILVAVSGGGDSTALLHVLSLLRPKLDLELVALGVDHGLRPEAAEELANVATLAASWEIPFVRVSVTVNPRSNLQASARDARMAALETARRSHACDLIATAHHADDRAETFLIRLLGGATAKGLGVMPLRDERRIRPFLFARKAAILAHLVRNGIPYAEDPSNQNDRFQRVRIRKELLPLLETFNPRIVTHLGDLADELASPGAASRQGPSEIAAALAAFLQSLKGPHSKRVRTALARLPENAARAEVALPGGLVARYDRTHTRYVLQKSPGDTAKSSAKSRKKPQSH